MSLGGITGTTLMPTIPEEVSELRTQINQLHQEASDSTVTDSTSFKQGVHQLRSDVDALSQAMTALKGGAQGSKEPPSSAGLHAVKMDLRSAEAAAKDLDDDLNGGNAPSSQSSQGSITGRTLDVLA